MSSHPFYGKEIIPDNEQRAIEKMLSKYRLETPTDELKKKIYDDLSAAKTAGKISIPFKVVLRKDPTQVHRDYIEVILDTKV